MGKTETQLAKRLQNAPITPGFRRVGVRFPSWITFQRSVFDGILDFVRASEPWIIETPVDSSGELPDAVIDQKWRGDGLIVFRYSQDEASAWRKARIPVVNLSSECIDGPFPSVIPDNIQAGVEAARHLLTLGLEHYAYLGRATAFVDDHFTGITAPRRYSAEREAGFTSAISAARRKVQSFQLSCNEPLPNLWKALRKQYRDIIRKMPKPCGIFAVDDLLAHGVLQAAHEAGIRVPQDIAIVGFNDQSHFCHASTPPLSSVTYPGEEIGLRAAETLFGMMQGELPVQRIVLRIAISGVTVRESTNVLAIRDSLVADATRIIRRQAASSAPRVGEVAELLGVSVSLLRQRFLDALGISPKQEIDRARIDIVRHWLAHSDLELAEIATRTGFAETRELRRFFRRETGRTPQEYRKSLRKRARETK
jgi:LacI family transcriptional regulator